MTVYWLAKTLKPHGRYCASLFVWPIRLRKGSMLESCICSLWPSLFDWTVIWDVWKPGQCFVSFVGFLKPEQFSTTCRLHCLANGVNCHWVVTRQFAGCSGEIPANHFIVSKWSLGCVHTWAPRSFSPLVWFVFAHVTSVITLRCRPKQPHQDPTSVRFQSSLFLVWIRFSLNPNQLPGVGCTFELKNVL